ncbi:hypothetical protein [Sphingosinicella soli]|uniref:Putative dienelactone hydrolase n=1 Tax=Sphingosinicella soli TaxID=333708 RepID=A0A7W7AYS6_9SPHN|nr:putative dienelactone hydrolase [Sphingosinicella soli]
MPLLDMIVFALLFLSAVLLSCWHDPRSKRAFLCGSFTALVVAAIAAWSLRWQIVPALVVSAVSTGLGAWMVWHAERRRLVAASTAGLTLVAVVPYVFFPIFDLPAPDGPFRVGIQNIDLRDTSRRGVSYLGPDVQRDIPLTIWYPASADAKGKIRPYLTRREALDEAVSVATLWGFPAYRFLSLHSTGTHAIEDADVAQGHKFPIVVFSHGYWSFRAQNSALMERLASHGYIAVSVAHPRDSADVRLQDGTLITSALHTGPEGVGDPAADRKWDAATSAFMGGESHEKRIAALPSYKAAVSGHRLGRSLTVWRDDVLFASRTLRDRPPPAVQGIMAVADFSRIAYAGMSFGGSTAASACDADPDCVAAVDLDGENFDGAQFDRALRAPLLLILTDQPFSDKQRSDRTFNPTDYAWENWHCVGDREDILRLRARGILHMGLTDFVLGARGPYKSKHFTSLDGERALAIINDTTLAFLNQYVRGFRPAGLKSTLENYPELQRLDTASLRAYAQELPGRAPCLERAGETR